MGAVSSPTRDEQFGVGCSSGSFIWKCFLFLNLASVANGGSAITHPDLSPARANDTTYQFGPCNTRRTLTVWTAEKASAALPLPLELRILMVWTLMKDPTQGAFQQFMLRTSLALPLFRYGDNCTRSTQRKRHAA